MSGSAVPDLSVWCREFPAGSTAEAQALRGNALVAAAGKYNLKNIDGLLRLAFGLSVSAIPAVVADFRTAVRTVDSSFAEAGNDRELHVMAAAVLAAKMAGDDLDAAQIATRCLTTSMGALRKSNWPVDLPGYALARVVALGSESRKRTELKRAVPTLSLTTKYGVVNDADFSATSVTAALKTSAENMIASVNSGLKTAFNQSAVLRSLAVQEEELQVLWWLTNAWSTSLDVQFTEVPKQARALVFARELSDITDIFPEARSLKGLLSRAGIDAKKADIVAAVNQLDRGWVEQTLQGKEPSAFVTPLHLALQRRLETQDDNGWGAGWASAVGITATNSLTALDLGIQMYREASILRSR